MSKLIYLKPVMENVKINKKSSTTSIGECAIKMKSEDLQKITEAIDELAEKVNMEKLYPKLFEHDIFSEDYPGAPKWEGNLRDPIIKKEILLEIQTRGNSTTYRNLVRCLEEIEQSDLIDLLENRSDGNILNAVNSKNDENNNPSKIEVIKSTSFFERSGIGLYVMQSKPRGLVLMITLINYQNISVRTGADQDVQNTRDLYEQMGFKVITSIDLTVEEMRREIRNFSQNDQFRHVDSCFVFISGHGGSSSNGNRGSVIYGIDYDPNNNNFHEELSYGEIVEYFTAENCPLLINKPKVFIFQACRGTRRQKTTAYKSNDNDCLRIDMDSPSPTVLTKCNSIARNYADIFIAHATLPDHVAYRNNEYGSWLHQGICKVFAENAHNFHLSELFCLVDDYVRSKSQGEFSQTVTTKMMGSNRLCYLNPGYP